LEMHTDSVWTGLNSREGPLVPRQGRYKTLPKDI
ncbi:unnamed protein product, partial [marine sediment metagenome]